jgi:hypothetical protein
MDDLCWWNAAVLSDPNKDNPAGSLGVVSSFANFPWQGTLALTQAAVVPLFIGVSGENWPITGNNPPIFGAQDGFLRLATGGVYEFACLPGSSFVAYQLVGPDLGAQALLPQQVVAVASLNLAIGRVESSISNTPTVRVRLIRPATLTEA